MLFRVSNCTVSFLLCIVLPYAPWQLIFAMCAQCFVLEASIAVEDIVEPWIFRLQLLLLLIITDVSS